MYRLLRPVLFTLPPEQAHAVALFGLAACVRLRISPLLFPAIPPSPTKVMNLSFPNPVGLAAGFDKNGDYLHEFARLGFGFIEVGTVTPRPQPGNSRPRLFRIPQADAIINRMGFNNNGVDWLVKNIRKSRYSGILGINIGKNRDTPMENARDDYLRCMEIVYPYASYIAVNISSPNTAGLRQLQAREQLSMLLQTLVKRRDELANQHHKRVPLAIKVAPDLDREQIVEMSSVFRQVGIDAVIATNTTIDKSSVSHLSHGTEEGGLSGKPLTQLSTEVIRQFRHHLPPEISIIGVGGIFSAADTAAKLDAGAELVQIYSGLVYRGPALVREMVEACIDIHRQHST